MVVVVDVVVDVDVLVELEEVEVGLAEVVVRSCLVVGTTTLMFGGS